jgi:hypothetical protein
MDVKKFFEDCATLSETYSLAPMSAGFIYDCIKEDKTYSAVGHYRDNNTQDELLAFVLMELYRSRKGQKVAPTPAYIPAKRAYDFCVNVDDWVRNPILSDEELVGLFARSIFQYTLNVISDLQDGTLVIPEPTRLWYPSKKTPLPSDIDFIPRWRISCNAEDYDLLHALSKNPGLQIKKTTQRQRTMLIQGHAIRDSLEQQYKDYIDGKNIYDISR